MGWTVPINLQSKFSGRRKNQSARGATDCSLHSLTAQTQQTLDGGSCESNRLSRTGSAASKDVATFQGNRNRGCLQSKGSLCSLLSNRINNSLS